MYKNIIVSDFCIFTDSEDVINTKNAYISQKKNDAINEIQKLHFYAEFAGFSCTLHAKPVSKLLSL